MKTSRVSAQYNFGEVVLARLNNVGQLEGVIRLEDGRKAQFHERDHREVISIFNGQDVGLGVRFREDLRKGFLWDIEMPGVGTKIICRVSKVDQLDKLFTATQWAYAKDWARLMAQILWVEGNGRLAISDALMNSQCPAGHYDYIQPWSELELRAIRRAAHRGMMDALPISHDQCVECRAIEDRLLHDTYFLTDEMFYFVQCPDGHNFLALYGSALERRAMEHGAITSDRAMPITRDECEQCDPNGHRIGDGIKELILGVAIPELNEVVSGFHPDITIHRR